MWLERLNRLVGEDKVEELSKYTVAIIGIGGVGGYAFETLVRSNIGEIIIVDNDIFDETNLNRQNLSLISNIGKKKVEVAKEKAFNINKNIKIISLDLYLNKDNINDLFKYKIDYLIDACDTVNTKIELIEKCNINNIPIISCMGMANKIDPIKVEVMKLKDTINDPLAKKIKSKTKYKDTIVVSSKEKPINNNMGSNSIVPAIGGILCANYIINLIINKD